MPTIPALIHPRLVFIDALRGVASLAVFATHLAGDTVMALPLNRILPAPIHWTLNHGWLGVEIFFVISGFVIAHSLRDFIPTGRFAGNFILRRQLRLDPAFWCVLILYLVLLAVENRLPGVVPKPYPSPSQVAANAFYVQGILGIPRILDISWTLCIEIQFYLVFIALLWISHVLARQAKRVPLVAAFLLTASGLVSLAVAGQSQFAPWFIAYWFYFAAGALCCWAWRDKRVVWFGAALLAALAFQTVRLLDPAMLVGLSTTLVIFLVARFNRLSRWSGGAVLQYFGRISYSLYLIHLPVLLFVLRAAYKFSGDKPWAALAWTLVTAVLCVLAAQLLFLCVERPSMRFASRFKGKARFVPDGAPGPGA